MTWPPVWRWRLTLPPPSTLSRLIQRPLTRSNLKGLNQTRSPCGTQGSSSVWTAMSGNPIAAMTCSVRSSVKAFSSLSLASSVALSYAGFNGAGRHGDVTRFRLVVAGVDDPDPGSVLAPLILILDARCVQNEIIFDGRRCGPGVVRVREVECGGAADMRRGHGGAGHRRPAAFVHRREDVYSRCPEIHAVAEVAPTGFFAVVSDRGGRDDAVIVIPPITSPGSPRAGREIGRASCRERV